MARLPLPAWRTVSWLNRIEAQFTALRYFALDGTDHASHKEQASMTRRYIIWRNNHAYDERLRGIVNRANGPLRGTSYQAAVMSCAAARARWAAARAMPSDRPVWPAGSSRQSIAAVSRWAVTRGSSLRASAKTTPSARAAS